MIRLLLAQNLLLTYSPCSDTYLPLLHRRVHNGQDLRLHQRGASGGPPPNLLMGLFGCLIFYDHVTSNALQSLEEMVQKTALFRSIRVSGAVWMQQGAAAAATIVAATAAAGELGCSKVH